MHSPNDRALIEAVEGIMQTGARSGSLVVRTDTETTTVKFRREPDGRPFYDVTVRWPDPVSENQPDIARLQSNSK